MMSARAFRSCPTPRCPNLTESGPCEVCRKTRYKDVEPRGSAASRGYGASWRAFRVEFFTALASAGIPPVCGATLPNGPQTCDSQCSAQGYAAFTSEDGTELHLDHEPPLTGAERNDPTKVCDKDRIQLLCRACHSRKAMQAA